MTGCPACEFARRRGELRQLTADGCPCCDGVDETEILTEIAGGIAALRDIDATDRQILRVALSDLLADCPLAVI